MTEIAKIVLMRSKPGQVHILEQALHHMLNESLKETGCAYCVLHRSVDDNDLCMVYERWHSVAAFAAHMETPHAIEFLSRVDELLAEAPEVLSYDYLP